MWGNWFFHQLPVCPRHFLFGVVRVAVVLRWGLVHQGLDFWVEVLRKKLLRLGLEFEVFEKFFFHNFGCEGLRPPGRERMFGRWRWFCPLGWKNIHGCCSWRYVCRFFVVFPTFREVLRVWVWELLNLPRSSSCAWRSPCSTWRGFRRSAWRLWRVSWKLDSIRLMELFTEELRSVKKFWILSGGIRLFCPAQGVWFHEVGFQMWHRG